MSLLNHTSDFSASQLAIGRSLRAFGSSVFRAVNNVVATITANLRAAGKQIGYDYDFNRLKSITYPDFPGNNVTYAYGGPGASDNRAGRIAQVTNESGSAQRFYDKLGATPLDEWTTYRLVL